jgi:hypothetical protein
MLSVTGTLVYLPRPGATFPHPHAAGPVPFGCSIRPLRRGAVRGLTVAGPTGTRVEFRFRVHRIDRGTASQREFPPSTGLGEDGPAIYFSRGLASRHVRDSVRTVPAAVDS